tara:strand:+ start:1493 stop:2992 length:1500 start_codon:yes stop_codon:yes gene_type:complete
MNLTKNILIPIILFITLSCTQKNAYTEKKEVVVTGKIIKHKAENLQLNFIYSQPGIKESTVILDIDSIGNFEYRIESYIPLDATILNRSTNTQVNFIYHPGDSIHLEFEAKAEQLSFLKTVKFSGDGAKTNNQIVDFQILREENNLGYGAINETESYKKEVGDFILEMNALKDKQLKNHRTFIEEFEPTDDAKKWVELFALESYYYFSDKYSWENTDLPDNYFDYTEEILPITTDKLICWTVLEKRITTYSQVNLFQKFEKQYADIDLMNSLTDKTAKTDSLFIKLVKDNSSNSLLNQLVYSGLYKSLFEMNLVDSYLRNQVAIETELNAPFILHPLRESLNKVVNQLEDSKDRTAILLKQMKNTVIAKIFDKILEENEGKVIYVDCWATWCGPCIKEMPDSKKLMTKFKQQDVAFVYMCLDNKEKKWKELLSEFKLDGSQQYLLTNEQTQILQNIMQFSGVPYHILIDKNGQITEKGHNLRPSMQSTEEKIIELIDKI